MKLSPSQRQVIADIAFDGFALTFEIPEPTQRALIARNLVQREQVVFGASRRPGLVFTDKGRALAEKWGWL